MTTAPTLVAILTALINGNRPAAEHLIADLDPHRARMALREASVLLAQSIRIIEGGDEHGIADHLNLLRTVAEWETETSG